MYLVSHFETLLVFGENRIAQTRNPSEATWFKDRSDLLEWLQLALGEAWIIALEAPYCQVVSKGRYLCAEPDGTVAANRHSALDWETFRMVEWPYIEAMLGDGRQRLAAAVAAGNAANRPVKLHLACGHVPIPGFLNIDISRWAADFAEANPDQYFLLPTVGVTLPLPDNSVDFIFHEDFIEHIGQLDQISFLAEMHRILRPGGIHRVNTPNLIWTMMTRSDFSKGAAGVYVGERQHEHVALFSPAQLAEVARMVGYREIHFNARGKSISPHAIVDRRPYADRDETDGNIFADLVK